MDRLHDRIVPLNELDDFEVADGDPDVRGWEVVGADRQAIGKVDNLLVDTAAKKVRYLDVDLRDGVMAARTGADRHILVPIGHARLEESSHQVLVNALLVTDLEAIPAYARDRFTPEYEAALEHHFAGRGNVARDSAPLPREAGREGEERLTLSQEELVVGKREVTAGAVEIEKEVETEHVRQNVPVYHEEVIVERRPATPGMSAQPRIENDEIHVPLHKEELVVDKRVVPKEELIVRKRETVETETVEADLRRENVDVHREDETERPKGR